MKSARSRIGIILARWFTTSGKRTNSKRGFRLSMWCFQTTTLMVKRLKQSIRNLEVFIMNGVLRHSTVPTLTTLTISLAIVVMIFFQSLLLVGQRLVKMFTALVVQE